MTFHVIKPRLLPRNGADAAVAFAVGFALLSVVAVVAAIAALAVGS